MSRTKKSFEKKSPEESNLSLVEPIEIVTTNDLEFSEPEPIAEETHRVVRTWKKKVPVEDAGNVDVIEVTPEPPAPPRPPDPIEELLKEMGVAGHSWTMTVWHLPKFHIDGNCSPNAKKNICGTFPFDENYDEFIGQKFARPGKNNDFLVAVRRDNRIYAYLPVVQPYCPEPLYASAPEANHALSPVVESRDAFSDIEKSLRLVKRFNDTLGISNSLAPVEAPKPKPLTTEDALLKLASEDPEMLARVRDRIFGRDEMSAGDGDNIWTPIVKELAPNIPTLIQGVLLYLGGQSQSAAPAAPVAAMPPVPEPPPLPRTPTVIVMENLIGAIGNNANVKEFATWLERFEANTPDVGTFLNFLIDMTPDQVLNFIISFYPQAAPVTQMNHSRNWIHLLQQEMDEKESAMPSDEGSQP